MSSTRGYPQTVTCVRLAQGLTDENYVSFLMDDPVEGETTLRVARSPGNTESVPGSSRFLLRHETV